MQIKRMAGAKKPECIGQVVAEYREWDLRLLRLTALRDKVRIPS